MIVAMEMQGLNDTRPFMLTWNHGDKSHSLDIPKNIHKADLEAGWNVGDFHINLTPYMAEDPSNDDGNGEHRYWIVSIINVAGETPVTLASGSVSWGEFFVMEGLTKDDFVLTNKNINA